MDNGKVYTLETLLGSETAENEKAKTPRKRSMTTLKLQWIAERVRRCRKIQEEIANGTYHVDSREVATALLNLRETDTAVNE